MSTAHRQPIVLIVDWIVTALLVVAVVIDVTGGFFIRVGAFRISARSADRAVLVALGLILVRSRIGRGISPLGGWLAWVGPLRDRLFDRSADPEPSADRTAAERAQLALAFLGIFAIGAVLLRTQLAHMDSVPDLGDPLFSMWRMGWVFHQVQGDPRPLFDANIFYPEPLTLTYSDSMLLPSLLGAPLLAIGLHPVIAYNILFVSGFALSAITTYLLVARITGSARAGFIGGLLYGFYPYRFEHYSHLELQMTQWMPLGLIALHRFTQTLRVRHAVAAALCAVAQLYSAMYYGVFFPLYAAAIGGVLLLLSRPPWRRLLVPVGVGAALAIGLAVPLARPYLSAQTAKGERDAHTVTYYSATTSDYFRAHPRSALYGRRLLPDEYPERALFPGATPLVLSAIALAPPIGAMRLAYLAGLLVAFDLSRGFNGRTYPGLYEHLLPIRGMRVPARVSAILAISLAVLGGFGARRLINRGRTARGQTSVFALLVLGVAIDLHPVLDLQHVWPEPPPVYAAIASDPRAVLAEIPFKTNVPEVIDNIQYMYFSLWHWRPMVNGYSGFTTLASQELQRAAADFPAPGAIAALKARGATHVTVNCAFLVGGGCEAMIASLDGRPDFRRLAAGRWEGSAVVLYELVR
jgi:hypothetical protein